MVFYTCEKLVSTDNSATLGNRLLKLAQAGIRRHFLMLVSMSSPIRAKPAYNEKNEKFQYDENSSLSKLVYTI